MAAFYSLRIARSWHSIGDGMANLNPLKYCFHGQHSRPRATFRTLPGVKNKREVCAECFEKIMADRKQKKKLR